MGHRGMMMREESSEVTAVEGHSDMLFDAATYASEGHLMDRYRNLLGPIFEDVLRNVHDGFVAGYKVRCFREGGENYHLFRNEKCASFFFLLGKLREASPPLWCVACMCAPLRHVLLATHTTVHTTHDTTFSVSPVIVFLHSSGFLLT